MIEAEAATRLLRDCLATTTDVCIANHSGKGMKRAISNEVSAYRRAFRTLTGRYPTAGELDKITGG